MKLSEHVAEDSEESHPMFRCTNVIIPTPLTKGLGMHMQMKHRISQPDGINDSCVGDSKFSTGGNIWCPPQTLCHTPKSFTLRLVLASKKKNIP